MALIDVSELLYDMDFIDPFTVTRGVQLVDDTGRATVITPRVFPNIIGSVQPMSGRTLQMMPDMVNVSGAIEIWTGFRLEGPSDTTQADVVTWQGRNYTVSMVQSYNNYGHGYVHAVCQLLELLAQSPNINVIDSGP